MAKMMCSTFNLSKTRQGLGLEWVQNPCVVAYPGARPGRRTALGLHPRRAALRALRTPGR